MLDELKEGANCPQVERLLNPVQRGQKMLIRVSKDGQPDGTELLDFEMCLSDRDRKATHYPWQADIE